MSKITNKSMILEEIKIQLESNINGLRYSQLTKIIYEKIPNINKSTVQSCIVNLEKSSNGEIYKVEQGLFRLAKYKERFDETESKKEIKTLREEEFYQPFAEYLVNELEDCNRAIPLGGKILKDKWGTPDVIGVLEPRRSDIIQFPIEIVSAEIKLDKSNIITAFGQACAYKIFSHKAYVVIPNNSLIDDISRIDALCRLFGIGLILFDSTNIEEPRFEIRVRAHKNIPDMFYVNKYLKEIESIIFPN